MREACSANLLNYMHIYMWKLLCTLVAGLVALTPELAMAAKPDDGDLQQQRARLEQVVLARIAFYARHYPDIDFVVLDSAGNVAKNMQILARILGEDPDPLDYMHPADLRHTLLMSMLVRIQLLLQTDVGSATLFAPGKGALARRKQVCVVTLNPWAIAKNNAAATRHLLEISQPEFDTIPHSHYLDHISHLKFAMDHEVYHCLDTRYNGPIPMSDDAYWGEYHMLRNEDGADAFGILRQMAEHGKVTAYDRTLGLIRGLTLLNDDPNHYTYPAIEAALQVDPQTLEYDNVQACFRLATRIRDRVSGSYADFLRYAAAAERAMLGLGVTPGLLQFKNARVDQSLVKKLIVQTRHAYQDFTGHPLPIESGGKPKSSNDHRL